MTTYNVEYRDASGLNCKTTIDADSDDAAVTKARLYYGESAVVLAPRF
jgi:hypothetical protein